MELKINEMYGVGRAKYVVNYYTGKKHQDGSDFFDIRIFKNEKFKNRFVNLLKAQQDIATNF
jgi:hypothetical protein